MDTGLHVWGYDTSVDLLADTSLKFELKLSCPGRTKEFRKKFEFYLLIIMCVLNASDSVCV